MRITKIQLANLHSLYGTLLLDFDSPPLSEAGLFAIVGDTGAGKTTILDAITLALFGQIARKEDPKEIISYGTISALAEVEFEIGQARYRAKWTVHRARGKANGNLIGPKREFAIKESGEKSFSILAEKIKDVDLQVEKVSGLDFTRFCKSALLAQGDFAAFLQAKPPERSEILERITGTEIYSQISRSAFQKHKLEKEKYAQLSLQLESHQLLSPETVEALKLEEKELSAKIRTNKSQNQALHQAIQVKTRALQLQQNRNELQKTQATWEYENEKAQPALFRLNQHLKFQPFIPRMEVNEALSSKIDKQQAQIHELHQLAEDSQHTLSALQKILDGLTKREKQQEEHLASMIPVFDQVQAIDANINSKSDELDRLTKHVEGISYKQLKLEEEKVEIKNQLQDIAKRITDAQTSLAKQTHWEKIRPHLTTLDRWAQDSLRMLSEKEKLQKELDQQRKLQAAVDDRLAGIEASILQKERQIDEKTASLHLSFGKDKDISWAAYQKQLDEQIEDNSRKEGIYFQLAHSFTQYQEYLSRVEALNERVESLKAQEDFLNKKILALLEEQEIANKEVEIRKKQYDLHQKLATYEEERNTLKDGDPCPLCGAIHHPFVHETIAPLINQSQKDVESAQKKSQELGDSLRTLQIQQHTIASDLVLILGQEKESGLGYLQEALQESLDLETKIAKLKQQVSQSSNVAHAASWQDAIDKLRKKQSKLKKNKSIIQEQYEQIKEWQFELDNTIALRQEVRLQQEATQQLIAKLEKQLLQNQDTQDQLQRSFSKKTQGISSIPKLDLPGKLSYIRDKINQFMDLEATFKEDQAKRHTISMRLEELEKTGAELLLEQEKQQREVESLSKTLVELRVQREELFGNKDVQAVRQNLQQQLTELQTGVKRHSDELEKEKRKLVEINARQDETKNQLQQLREEKKQNDRQIQTLFQQFGLQNLDEVKPHILDADQKSNLEALKKELDEQRIQLETQFKALAKEEKEIDVSQISSVPLPDLIHRQEKIALALDSMQQQLGSIDQQLKTQAEQQKKYATLQKKLGGQEKELRRWESLQILIGSADGKKYRNFAQTLTLQQLIRLANKHLDSLNPRYLIELGRLEQLALEIIDTYQAHHRRSMSSLSGGESFLVSLALALALSELAGSRTQIHSLFIDEGFGTLDDTTLDMALNCLDNLQASGKTIGIISHVKALKERVFTQVQIIKKGSGKSEVRIMG